LSAKTRVARRHPDEGQDVFEIKHWSKSGPSSTLSTTFALPEYGKDVKGSDVLKVQRMLAISGFTPGRTTAFLATGSGAPSKASKDIRAPRGRRCRP
jgi:hypothetical protein